MGRRLVPVAVVLAALPLVPVARADAASVTIGTATTPARISAAAGWVVWNRPRPGGFELVAWRDGRTAVLGARPSPQPFDVDVGTDARGRVVATFSRCARPAVPRPNGTTTDPRGCHVRVLGLATGIEEAARIPRPKGTSDANPSMWGGRIAFARHDPERHEDVEQVLLWSPATRRLTRLPHGAVPTTCPFRSCEGLSASGAVRGLDLGRDVVSFRWLVLAPAVVGHGGFEVRAVRLRDRRSVLAGAGFVGEVCTGGADSLTPSVPSTDGSSVWYSSVTSSCFRYRSRLSRFTTRPVTGRRGLLDGIVLQVVKDGPRLYALVAPPTTGEQQPACDRVGAPCTIERSDAPVLERVGRLPRSPFF